MLKMYTLYPNPPPISINGEYFLIISTSSLFKIVQEYNILF